MELKKTETIKQRHDHYIHKTDIIYPLQNVRNMINSWKKSIKQYEEWLSNYDKLVEEAEENAIKGVELDIKQNLDNLEKIDKMSDGEKLKYWKGNFEKEKEQWEEVVKNKDKLIERVHNFEVQMASDLGLKMFKQFVREVVFFEEEFSTSEWNIQYKNFKDCYKGYSQKYKSKYPIYQIIKMWAEEFYEDAEPETHSYWLMSKNSLR